MCGVSFNNQQHDESCSCILLKDYRLFVADYIFVCKCIIFFFYRRGVEGVHGVADGALPGPEGDTDRHEVRHIHQGEHRLRDSPGRGDDTAAR